MHEIGQPVGHLGILVLAQEVAPPVFGEEAAPFVGQGVVVAVGVDEGQPVAQQDVGEHKVLMAAPGVVVVLHLGHPGARAQRAVVEQLIQAGVAQVVLQDMFQGAFEIEVDQAHAAAGVVVGIKIGVGHAFGKQHGVIARGVGVKQRVPIVGVGHAVGQVVLGLDAAAVAGEGVAGVAEEIGDHVFGGVEAEAVALGFVHEPARGPDQVGVDILRGRIARGTVGGIEGIDVHAARGDGAEAEVGILVRLRGLAHEGQVGARDVPVAGLVGDVQQVAQGVLLDGAMISTVVMLTGDGAGFLEKEALRDEVKILGQHVGVKGDRRIGVAARHPERIVIHHIVEIDADAEPVRGLHQLQQFMLGAIPGGDGAVLVLIAQIEPIVQVVAHRPLAACLVRNRDVNRAIPDLCHVRHPLGNFPPGRAEPLHAHLRA